MNNYRFDFSRNGTVNTVLRDGKKMSLLSELSKPFLYTFYFLAQNPFPSTTFYSQNKCVRCLSKLPIFVLICVSLYVTIYSFTNDQYVTRKNHAREIIHVLLIISSSITNLTIAYQCLFLSQTWTELQQSFCRLETEFQDLLPNVTVQLREFRKHFIMKCAAMLVFYIISILSMIMSHLTDDKFVTSYMVVLALFNDLSAFQTVFCVDLSRSFMIAITQAFRIDYRGEKPDEAKFIRSMKKLHLSIWKTVDKINEYFGLFLLGYIVQQFLMISYDIYWIFLNKFDVGIWLGLGEKLLSLHVLVYLLIFFFFFNHQITPSYS